VTSAAALGGLEMPHGHQQCQIMYLTPHHDGTKLGRRINGATWSLVELLHRGFSRQVSLCEIILGHFDRAAKPSKLGTLYSETGFNMQGFNTFTAAQFVAKCHNVNTLQKLNLCRLYLRY